MKSNDSWSYPHYRPFHEKNALRAPYVCRIQPFDDGFGFDFIDCEKNAQYKLILREKSS